MLTIFFFDFFVDAVCARFRIDHNLFDDFFRTCLRRTLAQMLCDVRREQRRAGNGTVAGVACIHADADVSNEEEMAGNEDNGI